MQFETILPFLRPIEHLILDPDISEIMVNAGSRIFIERNGELEAVNGVVLSEQALYAAVKNIARRLAGCGKIDLQHGYPSIFHLSSSVSV